MTATPVSPAHSSVPSDASGRRCPMCGGENTQDAVFCANPECHKALGDFRYVEEELRAELDYEASVLTYRKIVEMDAHLRNTAERLERLEAQLAGRTQE
jgi:hypothetical protein